MTLLLNETACMFIWSLYIYVYYDDEEGLDFFPKSPRSLPKPKVPCYTNFQILIFQSCATALHD